MAITVANPFGAFMAGREAREAERTRARQAETQGMQNALLRMQIEQAPQQQAQEQEINALRKQQLQQQVGAGEQESRQRALEQVGSLSQQALASGDPRGFVARALANPQYAAIFSAAGIDPAKAQEGLNSPDFERNLQVAASMGPQVSPDAKFNRETAELNRKSDREFQATTRADERAYQSREKALDRQAQLDVVGARTDAQSQKQQKSQSASLRKEFRGLQSVKDYEAVLPLIESAKNAPDTKQGDLNLIYTVGKIYDPGSVVREGELKLTQDAAPFLQQLIGKVRAEIGGKGRLTPQTRQELLDSLNERVGAYQKAYTRDYDTYSQYARDSGIDMNSIVGARPETAYDGGQGSGQQPRGPGIQPGQSVNMGGFTVTRKR